MRLTRDGHMDTEPGGDGSRGVRAELYEYGHFEGTWFVLNEPIKVKNVDGGPPLTVTKLDTAKMILPPGFAVEDLLYILLDVK